MISSPIDFGRTDDDRSRDVHGDGKQHPAGLGSYPSDIASTILEPFVSEANHWMVKHHAIFQGYNFFHYLGMDRNLRDNFRSSPYYEQTEEFVARYDNPAFDYDKPRLELATFEPLVRKVFSSPKQGIYQSLME